MGTTAKVSMAIGRDELAWAKKQARRRGKSLSSVVTEALAEQRRREALEDVLEWMGEGKAPVSRGELESVRRELRSRKR